MNTEVPLLKVNNLKTHFPITGGLFSQVLGHVFALDGVSFELKKGETLGLVGESGCGKSTLGRTILRLVDATSGTVSFLTGEGEKSILDLTSPEMKKIRRQMQMIFQDPFGSLDPRMSVEKIVTEPLQLHNVGTKEERRAKALSLITKVGLKEDDFSKYPHEFSGGQRQRIGIARALALNPELIIADEPVAALDVSIQAQVLNLLIDLKNEFKLTYIFISHDLAVVKYISDRVAVMYLGKIVELTTSEEIYAKPIHPYTRALMSSILHADPTKKTKHEVLEGDVPSPIKPPSGCAFHPRCKFAKENCKTESPQLEKLAVGAEEHWVSCHYAADFID